jgi:hypothetical protein
VEDLLGSGLDKRRRWWVFWSTFLGGAGEGGASTLMGISTLFAGSEAEEWTSELRRERKGDSHEISKENSHRRRLSSQM